MDDRSKEATLHPYTVNEQLREYIYRLHELGMFEGPLGKMHIHPELEKIVAAVHHVLSGGSVSVGIVDEGDSKIVAELDESWSDALAEPSGSELSGSENDLRATSGASPHQLRNIGARPSEGAGALPTTSLVLVDAVYRRAENLIADYGLPPEAANDLLRVMRANRSDTVGMLLDAALDAGLSPESAIERCVGIYFNICTLQIADDLADGDCDYLDPAVGAGTAAQYSLQLLCWISLLRSGLPQSVLLRSAEGLLRGAGPQHFEIRTQTWRPELTRALAQGFGVEHMSAYLHLLWHGTPLAERAQEIGALVGKVLFYYVELKHEDPRLLTLDGQTREALLGEALTALEALKREPSFFLRKLARTVEKTLYAASEQLLAPQEIEQGV